MTRRNWRTAGGPVRRILAACVCAAAALTGARRAAAEQWLIEGPSALGMGGAGVATVDDASAIYWNPAALATITEQNLTFEFNILGDQEGELIKEADEVAQLIDKIEASGTDFNQLVNNLNAGTASQQDLQDVLQILTEFSDLQGEEVGLIFNQSGHIRIAPIQLLGNLPIKGGLSIGERLIGEITGKLDANILRSALAAQGTAIASWDNVFDYDGDGTSDAQDHSLTFTAGEEALADDLEALILAIDPTVATADAYADELVFQAQAAGVDLSDPAIQEMLRTVVEATTGGNNQLVTENESGVTIMGIAIFEATFSLAFAVIPDRVAVGVNGRFMRAETYYQTLAFDDIISGADTVEDKLFDRQNTRSSNAVGIDVGVMVDVIPKRLRLGAVARNINNPEFEMANGGQYELFPQIRLGGALSWGEDQKFTAALDIDLRSTDSALIQGLEHQSVSLGGRWRVNPWWTLSAGVMTDFTAPETKYLLTGGMGFRLGKSVRLDMAGGITGFPRNIESPITSGGAINTNPESYPEALGLSGSLTVVKRF